MTVATGSQVSQWRMGPSIALLFWLLPPVMMSAWLNLTELTKSDNMQCNLDYIRLVSPHTISTLHIAGSAQSPFA